MKEVSFTLFYESVNNFFLWGNLNIFLQRRLDLFQKNKKYINSPSVIFLTLSDISPWKMWLYKFDVKVKILDFLNPSDQNIFAE